MFLIRNNHFPDGLKNLFERTSGMHSYNSRGSSINSCLVPIPRLLRGHFAMKNGLDNKVKEALHLKSLGSAMI